MLKDSINFSNLHIRNVDQFIGILTALFENSFESVIFTVPDNGQHTIAFANPAFCKMTGYKKEELIGKQPKILQGKETNPNIIQHLRVCLSDDIPFHGAAINYKKSGEKYHVEWKINSVYDGNNQLIGCLSVQRDLTYLKTFLSRIKQSSDNFRELVKKIHKKESAGNLETSIKDTVYKATAQEIDNMALFSADLRDDDDLELFGDELFLDDANSDGVMPIKNKYSVITAIEYADKCEADADDIVNLSSSIAECLEGVGLLRSSTQPQATMDTLVTDFQDFANLLFFMDEFVDISTVLGALSRSLKSVDVENIPGFVIDTMEALILELNQWVSALFVNRTSQNIHEFDDSIIGSAKQLIMLLK